MANIALASSSYVGPSPPLIPVVRAGEVEHAGRGLAPTHRRTARGPLSVAQRACLVYLRLEGARWPERPI